MRYPATYYILGLDLSLNCTGAALFPHNWGGDWQRVRTTTCGYDVPGKTKRERAEREGYESDRVGWEAVRLGRICGHLQRFIEQHTEPRSTLSICIEDIFLGKNVQVVVGLAMLRGAVLESLAMRNGYAIRSYSASQWRKTLHGTANGTRKDVKDRTREVLTAAGAPGALSEDEFDAMAIANHQLMLDGGTFFASPPPERETQ